MIPYKQLSLADIFQDCQNKFDNDKPAFLSLLETQFISILKKIFDPIRDPFAESKNGMIHIKSEPSWKKISITSKRIFVLPDAELKMRRLYIRI